MRPRPVAPGPAARRCGALIFAGAVPDDVTGGKPDPEFLAQLTSAIARLASSLAQVGADLTDLAALRVFYVDASGTGEALLRASLAHALPATCRIAASLVPVATLGRPGQWVEIDAIGILAPDGTKPTRRHVDDERLGPGPLVAGVRCGEFLWLAAQQAEEGRPLPEQSDAVMRRLGCVLAHLGAGFDDVVKMNRWYVAQGTVDVWEPSARAVAAFFAEPGPVATAISLPGGLPDGALIRIELLGMIGIDGSPLPKSHAWPAGHWDWPIHLPYKHGLTCGDYTFVGGQVSIDQQARVLDPDDFRRQTLRSLGNIGRVLEAGADARASLVKLWAYYGESSNDGAVRQVLLEALRPYGEAGVQTTAVPFPYLAYPDMQVEIEAVAWQEHRNGMTAGVGAAGQAT